MCLQCEFESCWRELCECEDYFICEWHQRKKDWRGTDYDFLEEMKVELAYRELFLMEQYFSDVD